MNQPEHPWTFIMGLKTVIVVVMAGQAKEQAWRSHLSKNPADRNADIKIFHFAPQKAP
jgi:hypothetical protein